ncbi:cbb3-type cytochrome c oxidase subunit 3 [Altererythrobacter sp.]|uniref:cbb3-type cytochrome c oxidase subunit 3 n=1 Tax=Altererythrobacter sp. TaxID=1872480 RepID=UPI001B2BBB47|nr:cbb3-type cytochrome c oxidase subunit 3 [Altererythrobacter sp.]MBO6944245.1 cbb3-type cytochrome c oxidase subunit 3 [Altererythrobacter sp.]
MSTYETLRHFADSYGLLVTMLLFLGLCAWPFRPGAKDRNAQAANSILEDHDDGE